MISLIAGLLLAVGSSFVFACGWIAGKSDKEVMVAVRWFIVVCFVIFGLYVYAMSDASVGVAKWMFPMRQSFHIKTLYLIFSGTLSCAVACFLLRKHREYCLKVINWCVKGKG